LPNNLYGQMKLLRNTDVPIEKRELE
jgi:hypothetical protein